MFNVAFKAYKSILFEIQNILGYLFIIGYLNRMYICSIFNKNNW